MSFALLRFSDPDGQLARRHFTLTHRSPKARATSTARCVDVLRLSVRSIDHVWTDEAHTYVVLCDTEKRGIKAFLTRLASSAPEIVERGDPSCCVFPDDGMTGAALLAALDASARADGSSIDGS